MRLMLVSNRGIDLVVSIPTAIERTVPRKKVHPFHGPLEDLATHAPMYRFDVKN
jgi:hypothetical protein